MNKSELVRAVARETRRTSIPSSVVQTAYVVDLVIEQIRSELLRANGRVELEGLVVFERKDDTLRARVSPALKRYVLASWSE